MKNSIKCCLYRIIHGVAKIFMIFIPIKQNQIIFLSHRGGCQYSDSPRVITEYLQAHYPGSFDLIWIVNDLEKFRYLEQKGIKIVRFRSLKEFYYLNTSKVCITNCGFNFYLIKRKNQLLIHTLHGGGAYKSNKTSLDGYSCPDEELKYSRMKNNEYDIFLSGSKMSSEFVIRSDFGYKGNIIECGMPRNDIMFTDPEIFMKKIRTYYGIENSKKVVLVAPTWRSDDSQENIGLDFGKLVKTLGRCYGSEWVVLLRLHHLSKVDITSILRENDGIVYNATDYPDIQELLMGADFLISDFSSLIWDYALTRKPILLYVPDLPKYTEDRGFVVPFKNWGLLYAENMQDLIELIETKSFEELEKISAEHLRIFGSFENGHATENICSLIMERCS